MDLGAPAFLPAAAVSALYGLVHVFDMRGRKPDLAPLVADAAITEEVEAKPLDDVATHEAEPAMVEAEQPRPAASEPKPARQATKKPSRKRAKKAVEAAIVAEPREKATAAEGEPVEAPIQQAEPVAETDPVAEETFGAEAEPAEPVALQEPEHWPVTPLFEPEPFVRQQRAVFGRKAG